MGNRTQGLVSKETVHATQSGHSSAHPQLCSEQLSPPVDMVNICLAPWAWAVSGRACLLQRVPGHARLPGPPPTPLHGTACLG